MGFALIDRAWWMDIGCEVVRADLSLRYVNRVGRLWATKSCHSRVLGESPPSKPSPVEGEGLREGEVGV